MLFSSTLIGIVTFDPLDSIKIWEKIGLVSENGQQNNEILIKLPK